jgi:MFS family permease
MALVCRDRARGNLDTGWVVPFAFGNVLGPLLLGPLFDKVGRKPMIVLTYAAAGLFLAATGWMFQAGLLSARSRPSAGKT